MLSARITSMKSCNPQSRWISTGSSSFRASCFRLSRMRRSTATLKGGPFRSATALRYEARSKDPDEARTISAQILTALRRAGMLKQMLGVLDDFDDDLGIYRRIQSVMLI